MKSLRRWHFYKGGEVELTKLVRSYFPSHSYFGLDDLIMRDVLLNPAILKDVPEFEIVYQRPGQRIMSNLPHSVTGSSLLHVAWNFLDYEDFGRTSMAEFELCAVPRRADVFAAAESNPNVFDTCQTDGFSLVGELIDYYIHNFEHVRMPAGLVTAAKSALQQARTFSCAEPGLLVTIGSSSIVQDEIFDLPSSRLCTICTAPCPLDIYQFKTPTTTINCCNTCAFQYMTFKGHKSMPIAKYITFVSHRLVQDTQ